MKWTIKKTTSGHEEAGDMVIEETALKRLTRDGSSQISVMQTLLNWFSVLQ